jgi:hypothetical protein
MGADAGIGKADECCGGVGITSGSTIGTSESEASFLLRMGDVDGA